ncbi:MAG: hypothetical protein FJY95_22720 [Candidatus Handelsmanbacteria bacterium]|nr:hypothetical protein [Candidatus Handelsmanbacteria bacterium]
MKTKMLAVQMLIFLLLGGEIGCLSQVGLRRFATPVGPAEVQGEGMIPQDDGSIVFTRDRLEITVRVLEDEYLNRQFAANSVQGARSTNPYTFGDWKPWGQDWTPRRFTVLLVKVKNYFYPKVLLEPDKISISTSNGRSYRVLDLGLLDDYFSPYLRSYAGQDYKMYRETVDRLLRTLYRPDYVFSGQETTGYVVLPVLHQDVEDFTVHVPGVGVRFDYRSAPLEQLDLRYQFTREVYRSRHPREAAQ